MGMAWRGVRIIPAALSILLYHQREADAVAEQVYEHLVFDGHEHISLQRLPGMQDRCIRIGSAGKTFSLTGWKVRAGAASLALLTTCLQNVSALLSCLPYV